MNKNLIDELEDKIFQCSKQHAGSLLIKYHDLLRCLNECKEKYNAQLLEMELSKNKTE